MILQLTPNTHPILHERVKKCSYDLDRAEISKILYENMVHHNGVGLSANQIGINERVFIMIKDLENEEVITCFNPRIVKQSSKTVVMEEGCLSYPGIWLKIKRPYAIKVEFENEKGEKQEREFIDLPSRVFQHEYDHMEGIDFTQKVSRLRLDMAKKKKSKNFKKSKIIQERMSL